MNSLKKFYCKLTYLLSNILVFFIRGLRPLLGPATCKYEVTCGTYAIAQLQHLTIHKAVPSIIKRILSCNPLF